jgi:short-subunit dehydrogenase
LLKLYQKRQILNILITGASSGIGKELAKRYESQGHTIFAISRRGSDFEYSYECDVADFDKLRDIVREITQNNSIDMVIANAGISYPHSTDFMKFEEFKNTIDVNFLSIHALLESVVQQMKENKRGKIVLISSLAGYVSSPTSLAYSASKRAINSYAEGLRNQLAPFNIKVINIKPGFIESEMTAKNRFKMPFLLSLDKGVDKIEKAIAKNKKESDFPFVFASIVKIVSILPVNLKDFILKRLNSKKI